MASDDPLRSVSIALSILDCFAVSAELGPSAVAREVGIAKSTASRMLAVLAARGMLERREGGRYRLGLRMFEYGQLALNRLNLFEVSVPILTVLRDRVRDMVQLGVPIGAEILFLERFESQSVDPRFHGPTWRRVPGHSSSSGRAIAAFNPSVARAILEAGLTRRTRYTVVDARRLSEILVEVRRRGWASTDEELEEGISSVAAPVLVETGGGVRAVAAVSVVGPSARLRRGGKATIARHAGEAASRIGAALSAAG
ncbi:IclR family transcriptional regulator [Capillimicrobium parvum]|uniref:HTH-type transcriptional regulator KipR n=1 Tax=Capillimicrobium parvum TaxID=2884022 RepID=A0A9E6XZ09_9ACTN|nr:IclR family transcriptional regulator [Capillimicrobium parvum]UGS36577.1 HTH-type transcriptional regulator KipR [Capillimicrobium parvum]